MKKRYLIDESVIVFLNRADYQYHSELVAFLEDGRADLSNEERKHTFFMPHCSKIRLGAFRLYYGLVYMKKKIGYKNSTLAPLEKAGTRAGIATTYTKRFIKLPWLTKLSKRFFPKTLTNLFLYVNEAKSKRLQSNEKRRIEPEELITVETCEIALIANKNDLEIVSFNKDFEYFTMIPGLKKAYIKYINPDNLLRDYMGSR